MTSSTANPFIQDSASHINDDDWTDHDGNDDAIIEEIESVNGNHSDVPQSPRTNNGNRGSVLSSPSKRTETANNGKTGKEVEEIEVEEDDVLKSETLMERIAALQYIVPSGLRNAIGDGVSLVMRNGRRMAGFMGKAAWVISTSLILVGLPIFVESDRDHSYELYEKEQKLQQSAEQMISA